MTEQEGNTQGEVSSEALSATADVQDWRSSLPEDLKQDPSLKDFKGVDSLAKSYTELVKYQGNSIRIPGEDASEEARSKFFEKLQSVEGVVRIDENNLDSVYDRLGRPENVNSYKIPELEGINFDDSALSEFKNLAFSKGFNNDQLSSMLEFYAQDKIQEAQNHNALIEQSQKHLQQAWGNDYNNRIHGVSEVIKMHADGYSEDQVKAMQTDLSKYPAVIQALSDYYGTLKEKGSLKGSSSIQYGMTPQEARERIAEIRSNRELMKIFNNPTSPDHKALVSKMEGLYKIATTKSS